MFRNSILILMILSAAVGGMLFWQWKAYSKNNGLPGKMETEQAFQQITVESISNELKVTQTITGLINGKDYSVIVPEKISSWNCLQEDGKPCETKYKSAAAYKAENGKISLLYSIPMSNQAAFLLNDWAIAIPEASISRTKIEVVDYARREGTWVAGAPFKGRSEGDFIDYYVFEGRKGAISLYWQKEALYKTEGPKNIDYYTDPDSKRPSSLTAIKDFRDFPYLSVVFTDQYPEANGEGLIISKKKITQEALEGKAVSHYFASKFREDDLEEEWFWEIFAAYLTNGESNSPKGTAMLADIAAKLSKDELTGFMSSVMEEENPLTAKALDELLSIQTGMKTQFFTLNKNKKALFIPLYFIDPRKILVNQKEITGLEILNEEGILLYPFVEVMAGLGYEVEDHSEDKILLLNKGSSRYRFYTDRSIFSLNEENYGLLENPLALRNGKVYIKEQWLTSLFKASIKENKEQLKISL